MDTLQATLTVSTLAASNAGWRILPTGSEVTAYRRGRWATVTLDRYDRHDGELRWPAHVVAVAADLARALGTLRYWSTREGAVFICPFITDSGTFNALTRAADPFLHALLELDRGEVATTAHLLGLVRPVADDLYRIKSKTDRRREAGRMADTLAAALRAEFDL